MENRFKVEVRETMWVVIEFWHSTFFVLVVVVIVLLFHIFVFEHSFSKNEIRNDVEGVDIYIQTLLYKII